MLLAIPFTPVLCALQTPPPGSEFVALTGVPPMSDGKGKRIDPLKIIFRELTFVGRDADGTSRFLLDWKTPVSTRHPSPFAVGSLARTVRAPELDALRRRYLGRRLWNFGPLTSVCEGLSPRASQPRRLEPFRPHKILRIYALEKRPPRGVSLTSEAFVEEDSFFGSAPTQTDRAYVVLYDLPEAGFSASFSNLDWSVEEARRAQDPRNYGPPYNVLYGNWMFERLFSVAPPAAPDVRAIRGAARRVDKSKDPFGSDYLRGLTRRQLAWHHGWPRRRAPLPELLRAGSWNYGGGYEAFVFRSDRVVRHDRSNLPR